MKKLIVFVAGQGGHFSQFDRFYSLMNDKYKDADRLLVTDSLVKKSSLYDGEILEVGELRSKLGFNFRRAIIHILRCLMLTQRCFGYDRILMVSNGPGIAIISALIVKAFGGKVVHIETWSRFFSKSWTGRIMSIFSDEFYVQNKELLSLYKNSIYSGRL